MAETPRTRALLVGRWTILGMLSGKSHILECGLPALTARILYGCRVMRALSAFVCIRLSLNSNALCMYCTCEVVPLFAVSGHEGLWIMSTVLCLACSIVASLGALQRCSMCTVADTAPCLLCYVHLHRRPLRVAGAMIDDG
jgi:hypothetical protein